MKQSLGKFISWCKYIRQRPEYSLHSLSKFKILCFLSIFSISIGSEAQVNIYDDTFRKYSKRFFGVGFDWKLFKAQAIAESQLKVNAKSYVGAVGLMQLMPSTFAEIKSKNNEFADINDPEWNIAAGIYYDRKLWKYWKESDSAMNRCKFMFASYNAGRVPITRARDTAKLSSLNCNSWESIKSIAHKVPRWRHEETLTYVERIDMYYNDLHKNRYTTKRFKSARVMSNGVNP